MKMSRAVKEVIDMSTYFDAVLTQDMLPLYNGTPEEVRTWLEKNTTFESIIVCDGRTLECMSPSVYLEREVK